MDTQVVHVRINDAATGQPTPVRVRFVDAAGRYRAPLGRLEHFPTGFGQQVGGNVELDGKKYAYIDGACEILLPAGPTQVEVHKGFEYAPLYHTFDRQPGQISLRLQVERKLNLEAEGWYAGDVQAHFLSPQAAWLEGEAEGLHVVNLLAAQWEDESGRPFISGLLDFTGQEEPPKKGKTLVAVNTLNRGGPLGDLILLNCHRPVFPLRLGQEGFGHYKPVDWCRQCQRKGGLVVSTRFPGDPMYHEATGQCLVNALEWSPATSFTHESLPLWYASLNQGRGENLAIVGGSAKASNAVQLGAIRTYTHIVGEEKLDRVTYKSWIDAVRSGATFATRGPLIEFTLQEDQGPGGTILIDERTGPLRMHARARSLTPFGCLDIVCKGEVIAQTTPNAEGVAEIELRQIFNRNCWLAAHCWASGTGELLAHTSPIRVTLMP